MAVLNIKQSESLRGRALVIWLVITLSMLRIASWISTQIILIHAYGWKRVSREHLQMARWKPLLVVSNGEVLPTSPFVQYLIGVAIWIPSAILLLVLAFRLLPQPYQEAMNEGTKKGGTYAIWSILSVIFLFFALNMLPLKLALLCASILLAVLFLTARASLVADGET